MLVYYAAPGETDVTPPTIRTVTSTITAGLLTVTASVTDAALGTDGRVYVLVAEDPTLGAAPKDWRGFDLTRSSGTQWSGSIQLSAGTTEIEFLVQAKDDAGNVGYATNKATNFAIDTTVILPPAPTPNLDVTPSPANFDPVSGWYQGPAQVVVDARGAPAQYSVDGSPLAPVPAGGSFTISGDGIHSWTVISDGQTKTGIVRIDQTGAPDVLLGTPVSGGSYEVGTASLSLLCRDPSLTTCDILIDGVAAEIGDPLPTALGSHSLTVIATDVFNNTETVTVPFEIVPPVTAVPEVLRIDAPNTPQLIADGILVDIEFRDANGSFDDYTVTIDWGDRDESVSGSTSTTCTATSAVPQVLAGNNCEVVAEPVPGVSFGIATAQFVYDKPGVYAVTVTVTDAAGNSDSSVYEFVVVYDPSGGRVDGVGTYWSGNEAYDDGDPWGNLAFFGYGARYESGQSTPSGTTKLRLLGEFFFKSTSYDYLIVNDSVAVAEGVGRMNGQEDYRFRVQGIDNGWFDMFQITIWNDVTGTVVYDNGVLFDEGDLVLLGGIRVRS